MQSELIAAAGSQTGLGAQPSATVLAILAVVALLVGALWLWERGTRSARGFASPMQLRAVLGRQALRRGARELRPGLHAKQQGAGS
jgi:hypothetical protein